MSRILHSARRPIRRSFLLAAILLAIFEPGVRAQSERADPDAQSGGLPEWRDPLALIAGLMPRQELGVAALQAAHPEADGRGVIVAVLDTGVDLLHPGLRVTSTGLPKIVDYYDATDSGELKVDFVAPVVDGQTLGLTGRLLQLGDKGGAASEVRLGRIRAKSFFPEQLVERMNEERKSKRDEARRAEDDRRYVAGAESTDESNEIADEGPVFDVVVFAHEGGFACAIDTDEDGDLSEEVLLTDYRDGQRIARFSDELHFAMGVNISDDGGTLSFLFDGGGHGTHVAGIIGAFYENGHPLNGLAPGAQILAIKVGNHRLGGATTHMSIIKGLDYAARHGARVANASFGGGSFMQDRREETVAFADKLIDHTGLLCFFSAGNNGPALSTVGSPALSERVFSIGAMVSALTQSSNYGVLDPRGAQLFDFSSRGPLYTGDVGVDLLAPGVALSTLPSWFLSSVDSWNGTSMAAPQASGAMAVILSRAIEEGIMTDYRRVRRALESSARPIEHLSHVEQGQGMMNAPGALATLAELSSQPTPVLWEIEVENDGGKGGGLYERRVLGELPLRRAISVKPIFAEDTSNEDKAKFIGVFRLEELPEWARTVPLVHMSSEGARIEVELLPLKMREGLNAANVRAVEVASGRDEFKISMVAIRPDEVAAPSFAARWRWKMAPGERMSRFVLAPEGATRARLEAEEIGGALAADNSYTVVLAQPTPWAGGQEARTRLAFDDAPLQKVALAVVGGAVIEVVAYSRWQSSRDGELSVRLVFDGVVAADRALDARAEDGGLLWKVHAPLGAIKGKIKASVEQGVWTTLPATWELARDPRHADVGKDDTMFTATGRATIRANSDGEKLMIGLVAPDELDDFLDDAFFRIRDPRGREVTSGFLHQGQAEFEAPARGDYLLEATLVARGRRFLGAGVGRIIGLELRRPVKIEDLKVYRDIYSGLPGDDAIERVSLASGQRADFYVRIPDLSTPGRVVGKIVIEDELAGVPISETSITIRKMAPLHDAAALRELALVQAREDLAQAIWLADLKALDAAELMLAKLGEAANELDLIEGRLRAVGAAGAASAAGAAGAAGAGDSASAAGAADAAGVAEFEKRLTQLATEESAKETPDSAKLARVRALQALAAALRRDHAAAGEFAKQAREKDTPQSLALELDLMLARAGEDRAAAADAAEKLAKSRPFDTQAARFAIETAVEASRIEQARAHAETWLDRFPTERAPALELLRSTEVH